MFAEKLPIELQEFYNNNHVGYSVGYDMIHNSYTNKT